MATKHKSKGSPALATGEGHSKEKYTFFWKSGSPFSQWHPSEFQVDGVTYNCAEQYMMHQKAVLFGDEETANEILETDDPRTQKGLGRKVANFDEKLWDKNCRDIVKKGNVAKISQNPEMKKALFDTKGTTVVEASPNDRIWGIGVAADNPKAFRKATWEGSNWLGYCLTEVREQLMAEEQDKPGEASGYQQDGAKKTEDLEKKEEQFTLFFGKDSPFSQHHPVSFTVDGVTYNCAEQYMMHQKAVMFKDPVMEAKILTTTKPKEQKSFGRKVQNFVPAQWGAACRGIVKKANKAKFTQNAALKQKLLETVGTTLAEGSPRDRLWGIGLGAKNPKARSRANWRGKNLLGECLTQVRDEIMTEEESNTENTS